MKTEFFTTARGEVFERMALRLQQEMKAINNVDLHIIPENVLEAFTIIKDRHPCWSSIFLWELANSDTQRCVWMDCDIKIKNKLDYISTFPFSGVLDHPTNAKGQRLSHPKFRNISNYFNNGYFTMTRALEPMCEDLQKELWNPIQTLCPDQNYLSLYLTQYQTPVEMLPNRYNFMPKYYGEPPETTIHVHYAGMSDVKEISDGLTRPMWSEHI